jgi:hypothetical protein
MVSCHAGILIYMRNKDMLSQDQGTLELHVYPMMTGILASFIHGEFMVDVFSLSVGDGRRQV